jgi:hypothetical protein
LLRGILSICKIKRYSQSTYENDAYQNQGQSHSRRENPRLVFSPQYYESSISEGDEYSHLSSDSADFMCTNCGITKEQKGKRRYGKPQSYQT